MARRRIRDATSDPCIYCGSTLPRVGREHVIPQAFGRFHQNLTLACVCDDCNSYFAQELELSVARDGVEGFLRLQRGLKSPVASRDLLNRRMLSTIQEPGPYFGARALFAPDVMGESLQPVPVPQVGFRASADAEMNWIVEEDLTPSSVERYRGSGIHIRVVASRAEDQQRLIGRLAELGVNFIPKGRFEEPVTDADNKVWVETTFAVDQTVYRAVAKIAFNYAAKMHGSDFVRMADFDETRNYIRHGNLSIGPLVRVSRKPILEDDSIDGERQTDGHLVCLGWAGYKTSIVGSVSLFNELTYDVILCRKFSGVWREVAVGHLFDPSSREITPLTHARLVRLK